MSTALVESDACAIDVLLEKVYRGGGHDFRYYKRGTVTRRLERRLYAAGVKTYLEYMQFLDAHPEEYRRLTDYLTISVSGFFRSPYTIKQVTGLVLPEMVSYKRERGERSLRFWSAACARGEEPYSIAMMLSDFLGKRLSNFDISIFATDINTQALMQARAGAYSPKDVESLPGDILVKYFTCTDQGYLVNSDIRQMARPSYLDLVTEEPLPFKGMDCIFCCNLLIYLQTQLQERVLSRLYDSLASPGYLILGEVETPPASLREKLECLDNKAKIYKKSGRTL